MFINTETRPILIQIIEHRIMHMLHQQKKAKNNEEADYAQGYIDALRFILNKYDIYKGDVY